MKQLPPASAYLDPGLSNYPGTEIGNTEIGRRVVIYCYQMIEERGEKERKEQPSRFSYPSSTASGIL